MFKKTFKIAKISLAIAILITLLSFFIKLTPCFNDSKFGICIIPSPFSDLPKPLPEFYNLSDNPLLALIFQFSISFILIFIILLISKSKPKKILDLTKK